ncbi:MAG: hypothetical protein ACR2GG_08915 [Gemmatimonadaceae bacterium]
MEPEDRQLLHEIIGALEEADQRAERVALAEALEPDPEPNHELMAERSRQFIAKAEAANHDRALAALGSRDTSGPVGLAKSVAPGDLAALARLSGRVELRERIAREHEAIRERPEHATSWLYNTPSGSVDDAVRMVEQLNAAGS